MKVPLSWLKEFVDTTHSPSQIAHTLTQAGIEVEGIESSNPGFTGVVVAKVLEVAPHPNADKLKIAQVTDGVETYRVVCGAPNCRPGIKTALAVINAELKDETGKVFKIKKSKIRGEESFGMLCSGQELGLSQDSDGILEFSESMKEGMDLSSLYAETIFDLSLTPNLSHAGTVQGIARELAAFAKLPLKKKHVKNLIESSQKTSDKIKIEVESSELCPKYAVRMIENVKVGPSPEWLKKTLEASGHRSINNVVDATNYILHELGQPLHAFDYHKIEGAYICVRSAKQGESLELLDGKTRELNEGMLVIADKNRPLAVGGVMGGAGSEVTEATTHILLESAYFDPSSIRKTAKKLLLSTDASKRFERAVDPNGIIEALNHAAELIQSLAGGEVLKGVLEVSSKDFPEKIILCRLSRVNRILGTRLSVDEIENFFNHLEFKVNFDGQDTFHVTVPTFRVDINEEIDLVEEAARLYGYENFLREPALYQATQMPHAPVYLFEKEVRRKLIQEGLQEFVNCDLIGPTLLKAAYGKVEAPVGTIAVLNPVSVEQSMLRLSLLPGMLGVLKNNFDRDSQDVSGFELGRVHFLEGEYFKERTLIGMILAGKSSPNLYEPKPSQYDFRDLKGIIENLLKGLGIHNYSWRRSSLDTLHPGRQASLFLGSQEIGTLGEIHPAVQRRLDVPQRILFAEFDLYELFRAKQKNVTMSPVSVFPASERDWTLTLLEKATIQQVLESIKSSPSELLEKVELVDIYRSETLGADKKNATFRFIYRDKNKTIEQEAVDQEHKRLCESTLQLISGCIPT